MTINQSRKQFYSQGKYFDNFDEMMEYQDLWKDMPLDHDNAERLLELLKKDLLANIVIFRNANKFKNSEFRDYVENLFTFAMKELRGRK